MKYRRRKQANNEYKFYSVDSHRWLVKILYFGWMFGTYEKSITLKEMAKRSTFKTRFKRRRTILGVCVCVIKRNKKLCKNTLRTYKTIESRNTYTRFYRNIDLWCRHEIKQQQQIHTIQPLCWALFFFCCFQLAEKRASERVNEKEKSSDKKPDRAKWKVELNRAAWTQKQRK